MASSQLHCDPVVGKAVAAAPAPPAIRIMPVKRLPRNSVTPGWARANAPTMTSSSPEANDRVQSLIAPRRSEEHTSELQSLMRISYAVFCLKKQKKTKDNKQRRHHRTKSNNS